MSVSHAYNCQYTFTAPTDADTGYKSHAHNANLFGITEVCFGVGEGLGFSLKVKVLVITIATTEADEAITSSDSLKTMGLLTQVVLNTYGFQGDSTVVEVTYQ